MVLMLPLPPLMTNMVLLAMMMAIDGDDAMTNIFAAGGARRTRRFLTVKQRLFIAVSPSKRAQSIGRSTSTRATWARHYCAATAPLAHLMTRAPRKKRAASAAAVAWPLLQYQPLFSPHQPNEAADRESYFHHRCFCCTHHYVCEGTAVSADHCRRCRKQRQVLQERLGSIGHNDVIVRQGAGQRPA